MIRLLYAICACLMALSGAAAAAQATQPTAEQLKAILEGDYKSFVTARELDNRCPRLNYAHRTLLNDAVLASLMRLPDIASTSLDTMSIEDYYANIDAVAKPLSDEAKANAAKVTCDRADSALGETRLVLTADLFAHMHLSGGEFGKIASADERRLYADQLNTVQKALVSSPPETLNRYVAARVSRSELKGEGAARRLQHMLKQFRISNLVNGTGFDLRWNEARQGWSMFDLAAQKNREGMIVVEPELLRLHRQIGTGYRREYEQTSEFLIMPRQGEPLTFLLTRAQRETYLQNTRVRIEAGSGEMKQAFLVPTADYTSGEAPATATDCPDNYYCARFDESVSDAMKRRSENGTKRVEMRTIVVNPAVASKDGPTEIRKHTRGEIAPFYTPDLRKIFRPSE